VFVVRGEHVGRAERPHRDVVRRPRTDARDGLERIHGPRDVAGALEHDRAPLDRTRDRAHGLGARANETERAQGVGPGRCDA
jgi:hypothetical protein